MPWQYDQSSGELRLNGTFIGKGYSGRGVGRDNPDMEDEESIGPIPQGTYTIGSAYNSSKVGPLAIILEPSGHDAHGRTDFRVHGDNRANDASEGCIIMDKSIRKQIINSSDKVLEVVR